MTVLRFLNDNLESITFWASVLATGLGFLAFLAVCCFWPRVQKQYSEFWAKLFVAAFRLVAAAAAVFSRAVPAQPGQPWYELPWALTTGVAFVGYFLWEIAGAIGDHKHKQSKEKSAAEVKQELDQLTQDRLDAEQQALRLNWQLTHLRRLVSEKLQRVRRVLRESAGVRSLPRARTGLDPDEQVRFALECLASLLHVEAIENKRPNQNFRIGLFVERDGRLELLTAFELATRRHDPFSSYQRYADRYRLDNATNPAHAVRCVVEARTIIVSDCETDPTFEFFGAQQKNYLRSMIAHPLPNFCEDGITPVRAALLVDTDVPDFFREEEREALESLLTEFVARIDLEYAIRALTQ